MLKNILFMLIRLTFVHVLLREIFQRNQVTILLYHSVRPDVLDRHLSTLSRIYNFIPLDHYIAARKSNLSLPRKPLIITLDDGHASNRKLLPVFKNHGVRPTIFLCTGIVGTRRHYWFKHMPARAEIAQLKRQPSDYRLKRLKQLGFEEDREYGERQALSWEEVYEMSEYVDFQPHSMFHPCLPTCSYERATEEIAGSRSALQSRGFASDFFAYPNGDYTAREREIVQESGYKCALTIDPGFNTKSTDLFALKRIGIPDSGNRSELLVRASGLWGFVRYLVRGRYQAHNPTEDPGNLAS